MGWITLLGYSCEREDFFFIWVVEGGMEGDIFFYFPPQKDHISITQLRGLHGA